MNLYILENKIKNLLKKNLDKKIYIQISNKLKFFIVKDEELGDYSTNLIFLLDKYAPNKKNEILEKIKKILKNEFDRFEIVNNYLNFYISNYALLKTFRNFAKKGPNFFKKNYGRNQKVNIDYVSANPTGPLTLGNARGAVLGDALANVLKLCGFKVTKEYYVNDRGGQIEKLGKTALAYLNQIPWEDDLYQGQYIKEIALKFKKAERFKNNPEKFGKKIADYILRFFIKPTLKKFKTFHDVYLFESQLYKGDLKNKVLNILKKHHLLEQKEGALFLLLTKLGEHKDEVLIKQNGEATYFLSDIIHYFYKFLIKKTKIDILIVASDHLDHTRRLKSALKIFKIKEYQFQPIVYQFLHIKKRSEILRMSKRRGVFITLDELMQEIHPDIIRFFFLQKSPEVIIEFNLELAKQQSEDNPYWYVQYSYARLKNILKKSKIKDFKKFDPQKIFVEIEKSKEFLSLIKSIYKFQDLIYIVYKDKKVHLLTEFLIETAKKVHSVYEKEKILPSPQKVAFIYHLSNFISFILSLINISAVEKM
jgi:arginyl-tRNA synthetase